MLAFLLEAKKIMQIYFSAGMMESMMIQAMRQSSAPSNQSIILKMEAYTTKLEPNVFLSNIDVCV